MKKTNDHAEPTKVERSKKIIIKKNKKIIKKIIDMFRDVLTPGINFSITSILTNTGLASDNLSLQNTYK